MATLIELADADVLDRYDPALDPEEMENRRIYLFPRVTAAMYNQLPNYVSDSDAELSPEEQVFDLLADFCRGEPLIHQKQFHAMMPVGEAVWELKTLDVRLFGWFAHKDCFVATDIAPAGLVKRMNMYGPFRDQAVRFRHALDLNPPKFIPGELPDAVLSA